MVGVVAQPAAAATQTASVVVAPDDGGVIRKGQDLGVVVEVTNTGTDALAAGRLTSSLEPAPVASTTTLLNSIAHPSQVLLGRLTLATGSVPALAAGASARVRLTLTSDDITSILTRANGARLSGARLLYVQYAAGAVTRVAESSVVSVTSGFSAKVGFGTVIPVLAPAGTTGVVDTAKQLELVGTGGAWNHALRAAEAAPSSTIALDPAVIASIRLAGDAAPPEATGFLDELSRLPNETIRLPYADGDVTLERAAGAPGTLAPSSFAGVTLSAAVTDGPTPAPTATPGTTTASEADLTAWNWSDQTVAWPVPHTAGSADLTALGAARDAVLLPSDDIEDTTARRAAGPFASVGRTTVLVADATASSLLATAATSTDGPIGGAALATLTGLLASAAVSGEASSLIATTGRAADPVRLDRVLSIIGRQSWVQGRSLSQLATGTPTVVPLRAHSVNAARVGVARTLLAGEHDVRDLGKAITTGGDAVTAPQRLALLGMLSSSWSGDDGAWRTAATAVAQSFSTLAGMVRIADQSAPNLVGNDGTLSVVINNGLSEPVEVIVQAGVSNGALQFTGTSAVTVTVPAKGQNHGDLHFRSIRNGRTMLTLQLTTPNGTAIGGQVTRAANVSAGFDTIIAVVLLSALGLLLALGVYRNVKRRGRPRTAIA